MEESVPPCGDSRLMYTPELWMVAYSNLQSNKGAMTKGVNEDTLDGFSKARVDGIIQKLREGTYEPNPVRRTSIPTSNGNSRPLGIPSGTDHTWGLKHQRVAHYAL